MTFRDTLGSAIEGLRRNSMRSLLTTLGIVIGVGSVVLMISIGGSFQQYILDQVESFSGQTFEIHPKGLEQFGKSTETITREDVEAIRNLSTVKLVAPVIFLNDSVRYEREEIAPMVVGTTKEIFTNWALTLERGRLLDTTDQNGAKGVVVLGSKAASELFGDHDPLGRRVTIGERKYTVVGVLKSMGSALTQSLDMTVYVPESIARAVTGKTKYIDYISLQSNGSNDLTSADITALLRQRHDIENPEEDLDKDDFTVRSFAQASEIIGTVTFSITLFLGLIAGISLLVGGIGIMNIMLVSVTERTREIGLRKAVGARSRDILLQFLLEATLLTLLGGIVGILGGGGIGSLLALIAAKLLGEFSFSLSPFAILLSLGMAVGIGLGFGLYPARRAAALDPVEALRFE